MQFFDFSGGGFHLTEMADAVGQKIFIQTEIMRLRQPGKLFPCVLRRKKRHVVAALAQGRIREIVIQAAAFADLLHE